MTVDWIDRAQDLGTSPRFRGPCGSDLSPAARLINSADPPLNPAVRKTSRAPALLESLAGLGWEMTREQLAQLLSKENAANLRSVLDPLNERELEVFSILGQGYSSGQIRSEFGIPPDQLRELKRSIQAKLKLRDDVELLRVAVKHARENGVA